MKKGDLVMDITSTKEVESINDVFVINEVIKHDEFTTTYMVNEVNSDEEPVGMDSSEVIKVPAIFLKLLTAADKLLSTIEEETRSEYLNEDARDLSSLVLLEDIENEVEDLKDLLDKWG